MKIATWNVNSIRLRLPHLLQWIEQQKPDVVCLQEIKCMTDGFPRMELEQLGYQCIVKGQKGFNGVAVLSKVPAELITDFLRGDDEAAQSRYQEVVITPPPRGEDSGAYAQSALAQLGEELTLFDAPQPLSDRSSSGHLSPQERGFRVINIYAPNGNPVDSEKYPYKLGWTDRLTKHCRDLLEREIPFLVCGDFNIIPEEIDCYNPKVWAGDALFRTDTRERWRSLLNLGLVDAFRVNNRKAEQYSFYDYQAGAWQNNLGIRIDHFLLSPGLTDRLQSCQIDKSTRALEKPSDHVPVFVELDI